MEGLRDRYRRDDASDEYSDLRAIVMVAILYQNKAGYTATKACGWAGAIF